MHLCQPNIVVNNSDIERLNVTQEIRDYSLSTNLIDFLIKNGLPFFKSDFLLLVPTSNVESMLDLNISKAESDLPQDNVFLKNQREKYKQFKNKQLTIITISCQEGHFYVI